jgi:tRNA-dihydrouridine synthase
VRGRPWFPAAAIAALAGRRPPPRPDLAATVAAHYDAALSFHGRELGVRTMRKHLGWYLDEAAADADARAAILRADDPSAVMSRFRDAVAELPVAA